MPWPHIPRNLTSEASVQHPPSSTFLSSCDNNYVIRDVVTVVNGFRGESPGFAVGAPRGDIARRVKPPCDVASQSTTSDGCGTKRRLLYLPGNKAGRGVTIGAWPAYEG